MTINDILNTRDLTNVDIAPPLIKDGSTVTFDVMKVELVTSKQDPDEQNVAISLETAHECVGNKPGVVLPARRKFTHTISLKQVSKDGKDLSELVDRNLAAFKLAALGTKAGSFAPLEQYLGRQVNAVVSIQKDKNGVYADQNRIARFIAPKN